MAAGRSAALGLGGAALAGLQKTAKIAGRKLKVLSGVAAAVLPVLEPSKGVQCVVRGFDRSAVVGWHLALGWIGQLIAASQQNTYYLVFTDRRLLAFTSSQYEFRPRHLKFGLARAEMTGLRVRRGLFGARRISVKWSGGQLSLTVPRPWRAEAEFGVRTFQPALSHV